MTVRSGTAEGYRYFVAVGARLDEATEEWQTLLRACLIGIPVALLFAIGGGLWLGRGAARIVSSGSTGSIFAANLPA